MEDIREQFQKFGRVWLRSALGEEAVAELRALADTPGRPGGRVAPQSVLFQTLRGSVLTDILHQNWPGARLTRVVSFDKSDAVNWQLPWHQDRVIAVRDRADVPGFERWSRKEEQWHCEPPPDVLRQMLFVRVHLDPCDADSGAMEIALGSHKAGVLSKAEIAAQSDGFDVEVTEAAPGDVLVMSMLMVHRSPAARRPVTRRVLRADYALAYLPAPLAWAG